MLGSYYSGQSYPGQSGYFGARVEVDSTIHGHSSESPEVVGRITISVDSTEHSHHADAVSLIADILLSLDGDFISILSPEVHVILANAVVVDDSSIGIASSEANIQQHLHILIDGAGHVLSSDGVSVQQHQLMYGVNDASIHVNSDSMWVIQHHVVETNNSKHKTLSSVVKRITDWTKLKVSFGYYKNNKRKDIDGELSEPTSSTGNYGVNSAIYGSIQEFSGGEHGNYGQSNIRKQDGL